MAAQLKTVSRTGPAGRPLSSEKARRIVEAMRRSVARRGTAGSTFDQVSREAGVSRGLLHYYFGTKEQLLVEAVRLECEVRLELLEEQLASAQTADDYIDLMAQNLRTTVGEDPDFVTLVFELFTLSRRNEDIAAEFAALMSRTRERASSSPFRRLSNVSKKTTRLAAPKPVKYALAWAERRLPSITKKPLARKPQRCISDCTRATSAASASGSNLLNSGAINVG